MIKKLVVIGAILTLVSCQSTEDKQQSNSAEATGSGLSQEQLQRVLIARYQAMAGAWFVNKQCKILPDNEAAELEDHVGALNVYAQKNQLAPTQDLLLMQKNARFGASLPTYRKCGEEAKTMVLAAQKMTKMLMQDLSGVE